MDKAFIPTYIILLKPYNYELIHLCTDTQFVIIKEMSNVGKNHS